MCNFHEIKTPNFNSRKAQKMIAKMHPRSPNASPVCIQVSALLILNYLQAQYSLAMNWNLNKWLAFCKTNKLTKTKTFLNDFLEWKGWGCFCFYFKCHWILFLWVTAEKCQPWYRLWLGANRWQAIIWINDGHLHWRIYAPLNFNMSDIFVKASWTVNDLEYICAYQMVSLKWPTPFCVTRWITYHHIYYLLFRSHFITWLSTLYNMTGVF